MTTSEADTIAAWHPIKRVVFRFVFAYFVLYNLPFPFGSIPGGDVVAQPYSDLWVITVPWVGTHVFGVDIIVFPNGSGDTTFNYVQVFSFAMIAVAISALWSLIDRKRRSYTALPTVLLTYLRFSLASWMILYGSVKVIKSQFPNPSLDRLLQPFGDASPMGLLWTFMGASTSYTMFAGLGEMLGGLLLTTRRTALLGALICMGVMSNVVMLNFSFDVPVKLFSCHLLVMACLIAMPDLGRLLSFFLFNRGAPAAAIRPLFNRPWMQWATVGARTFIVAAYTGLLLLNAHSARKMFGDLAVRSPFYGVWVAEEFSVEGKAMPAVLGDSSRWRRVIFDFPQTLAIQYMSDSRMRYGLSLDRDHQTMVLNRRDMSSWRAHLSYEQPEEDTMILTGAMDGKKVRAKLKRVEKQDMLLVTRGFHWIQEYPFNR